MIFRQLFDTESSTYTYLIGDEATRRALQGGPNMASPYQDITPAQLDTLGPEVRRIDVREPDEFTGPLGHLPGAELVPLATVEAASAAWSREAPLLLICRSGGRSAKAAQALARRGFTHLYNLAGGMLAVRETPAAQPQG